MKILVVRPSPEGKELVNNLNNIGIFSSHISLFNFYPSEGENSIPKKIYELYKSDIIVIFSKKSIYYMNIYLKKNNLIWPIYPQYYAIGKNTSLILQKYVKKKFFFLKIKKIVRIY